MFRRVIFIQRIFLPGNLFLYMLSSQRSILRHPSAALSEKRHSFFSAKEKQQKREKNDMLREMLLK